MSVLLSVIMLTGLCATVVVSMRPKLGGYARRKKKMFVLFDLSPSMEQPPEKINSANDAFRSSVEKLKQKAGSQERDDVELIVFGFSSDCWVLKSGPIQTMDWEDVGVRGSGTHIGPPLLEVAKEMKKMEADQSSKYGRSVIIVISDGQPQDDWQAGLREVLATEPGLKCLRLAIGIGDDVDLHMLHEFVGNDPNLLPLHAKNAEEIVKHIEFVTTILPFAGPNGNGGVAPGGQVQPPDSDIFPQLVI